MSEQRTARVFRQAIRSGGLVVPGEKGTARARIIRRAHRVIERKAERQAGVAAQREAWAKYERDFLENLLVFLRALSSARKRNNKPAAWDIENQIGLLISGALARGLSRQLIRRLAEDLPWDDPELGSVMHPKANCTMWNLFVAGKVSLPMNPALDGVAIDPGGEGD